MSEVLRERESENGQHSLEGIIGVIDAVIQGAHEWTREFERDKG